jgi:hypothetical protein
MSAEAKRTLNACKSGVDLMIATATANQEMSNNYNNVLIPEYNAKLEDWKRRKKETEDAIDNWNKRRDEKAESKINDSREWNNCVATWECDAGKHDDWCRNDIGDGWYHAGKNQNCGACTIWGCSQCHGVCKKTKEKRYQEAESEIGPRPNNFNEPEPSEPKRPEQNKTDMNISCCANITQIVASKIDDSIIAQANECVTNLEQEYEKQVKEEEKKKIDVQAQEKRKKMIQKIGLIAIIILCFCLLLSIIFINFSLDDE